MKPTAEQTGWLWEQCGLEYRVTETQVSGNPGDEEPAYYLGWFSPDGKFLTFRQDGLIIDLNNLFKYAMPKLSQYSFYKNKFPWVRCTAGVIYPPHDKYSGQETIVAHEDDDPALALFWAIYKALGGD